MRKKQDSFPRAYLIGIKGVGMTALAQHLKARGYAVSGSDTREKFFTDTVLKRSHIRFVEGFSAGNVPRRVDLIVTSSAYVHRNPEVAEARRRGQKVYSYAEMLGKLFNEKYGIAVCGSHGKTTTSALLGYVFAKAGLRPNVMVGSEVPQFRGNALTGGGAHFIAETDEYQNKLRFFDPRTILLTNIDYDHPDFFPDAASYRSAFRAFVGRLPVGGLLVAYADDAEVRKVLPASRAKIVTYGFEGNSDWTARGLTIKNGRWHFDAYAHNTRFGSFSLHIPGMHNVLNALGVIALSAAHGIKKDAIKKALAGFRGTRRRFERKGTCNGAVLIDDYAHHPTEIRATLRAARELYPKKRIIAVFHPHTYTRTKALLKDFANSFSDADEVVVLDIYGSAREKHGGVSSKLLVKLAAVSHKNISHIGTIRRAASYLKKRLEQGNILLTLGAGDVWKLHGVLTRFQK